MAMELSHDMLKICGCLEPKEIYTLHRSESTIRVNCDNEFFIEIQALSTPTERSSGANSVAGVDRSGFAASTVCARGEAVRTPSPCIELEALSRVKSTILLNNDIFESATQTSVEK